MPGEASQIIEALAASHRVLVLGGMAVIAHGLSRTTIDADIWLEPMKDIQTWCDALLPFLRVPEAYLFDIPGHRKIEPDQLAEIIDKAGMVRVGGIDRYLDIFYQPNQLDLEDFDMAWSFATMALGKARVMDESFLIATKTDTGRTTDQDDISFLEKKLRKEISQRLSACDAEEAALLFSRYSDHVTCLAALANPKALVQAFGLKGLQELAEGGNPFAIEAIRKNPSP